MKKKKWFLYLPQKIKKDDPPKKMEEDDQPKTMEETKIEIIEIKIDHNNKNDKLIELPGDENNWLFSK